MSGRREQQRLKGVSVTLLFAGSLARHPIRYTSLLADKLQQHNTQTWLVNTGGVLLCSPLLLYCVFGNAS